MMKRKMRSLKFLVLSLGFAFCILSFEFPCYAASAGKNVKQGNRLYHESRFDEALQKYTDAGITLPDSDPWLRQEAGIVNFNMGAALYKKQDYLKAVDAFTRALTSDDKKLEADALYNLGNCKYKLGKLEENTDLSATVALLRESLDYYKRAIELDQKNTDARVNYEFVERELKALLDKLKQQQEQQGQEQQKDRETEDLKGQKTEAQKQAAQDEHQQQREESAQAQGQQQGKKQREERHTDKEESQQQGQNEELSEQGARALLERYSRDEAAPDYVDKRTIKGYDREALKDW